MAFSTSVLGSLVKKGLQKGGHGQPRTPPAYALVKRQFACLLLELFFFYACTRSSNCKTVFPFHYALPSLSPVKKSKLRLRSAIKGSPPSFKYLVVSTFTYITTFGLSYCILLLEHMTRTHFLSAKKLLLKNSKLNIWENSDKTTRSYDRMNLPIFRSKFGPFCCSAKTWSRDQERSSWRHLVGSSTASTRKHNKDKGRYRKGSWLKNQISCKNTSFTHRATIHQFPCDPETRAKWTKFV